MEKKTKGNVGNLIFGGLLVLFGFRFLFSSAIVAMTVGYVSVSSIVIGALLTFFGFRMMVRKKKDEGGRKAREKTFAPPTARRSPSHSPRPSSTFSFRGTDHQHILPTGLSAEKRLEQLNVLRDAGLYTKEQYQEAKAKILQQQ